MSQDKNQNGQAQQPPQMPPVRNVPFWDKEADIIIKGYEWEILFNSISNLQIAAQAANAVMSRNVVNGTIRMDFQKLNAQTLQYEDMTAEEKAPYMEDFTKIVDQLRSQQQVAKQEAIVDELQPQGNNPLHQQVSAEPEQEKQAPVVNMFGDKTSQNVEGTEPETDFSVE